MKLGAAVTAFVVLLSTHAMAGSSPYSPEGARLAGILAGKTCTYRLPAKNTDIYTKNPNGSLTVEHIGAFTGKNPPVPVEDGGVWREATGGFAVLVYDSESYQYVLGLKGDTPMMRNGAMTVRMNCAANPASPK